jgi:hypothetical protein
VTANVHPSHFAALKSSLFYISQTRHVSETNENPVQLHAVPAAHWLFASLAVLIIPHKTEGSEDASNLPPFIKVKSRLTRTTCCCLGLCVSLPCKCWSKCWIFTKFAMKITPLQSIKLWGGYNNRAIYSTILHWRMLDLRFSQRWLWRVLVSGK